MTPRRIVGLAVTIGLLAAGVLIAATGSPYALRVMSVAGCFAILAIGYQFIFGHAGALALSQGSFMGVGAYVSAVLATRYGWAFDAALPLSVAAPVVLAAVVALPVLRLQTHYFALATLIIAQVVLLVATQWESVTGGANGIAGVPGLALFGVAIRNGWPALVTIWSFVAFAATVAWLLIRGRRGVACALMRASKPAAWSAGLDTARLRFEAFLLSAAFAGLAGALYVHVLRVVSTDILAFPVMVTCLTIAVIGSRRRVAGAVVGAIVIVGLPEATRVLRDAYLLMYGVILLLVTIVVPEGLVVALERVVERWMATSAVAPRPAADPVQPTMRTAPGQVLELCGVVRRFGGVLALNRIDLVVHGGETVGIIGPNGSGKTTLLNVIAGLAPAQAGRVIVMGHDITRAAPHHIARLGVGRTFQTAALIEDATALENVAVNCTSAEAMGLLQAMGLGDAAISRCDQLPGAKRRNVEIARALALRPALLLLDEPASGLVGADRDDLARRLGELARQGLGLVIIEHDVDFLAPIVDRLVCLEGGTVLADGIPAVVRSDPRVIAAYLGSVPA